MLMSQIKMLIKPDYVYKVHSVDRVVDGDTVDLIIDLGFSIFTNQRIRIADINTPELRGGTDETKNKARIAKARVEELLSTGDIYIKTKKDKTGKYGRYLGYIYVSKDNTDINVGEVLLNEGLAVPYLG